MNSEVYVNILDNIMLPTLWQQFGIGSFLYHHNNAHVHKAKVIASLFQDNGMDVMNWPAESPDMNSIKHLWNELECRLRTSSTRPKAKL